ncbi:MAG: DNA adenine methylase [Epulopiscium sp.]|nr:DNA adenine methylase [Candidatus Epulonipiscium sp.]
MELKLKPFLKWAGGKTQLLVEIEKNLPSNIEELNRYVEPFVGAGALFLFFLENNMFEEYIINDINTKLINLYKVIRDNKQEFIICISELREKYLNKSEVEREKFFYSIRNAFNKECDNITQAAYMVFLNKTCFNGLFRENSKGEFNVPFGRYKNPSFIDEELIETLSDLLNQKDKYGNFKVKILNQPFQEMREYIDMDSFIYCDPPYRPVTIGGFNSYNKSSFNDDSQKALAEFYKFADKKGSKIMLSNSDPKNLDLEDEFFDDLYRDFNIQRVLAKRRINSNAKGRGEITELLITNY